ncbi:uncharacterized protein [Ptychodera flava]|uniref:uncharacterized protein n=1 Tax=Ptychodera flava TaxID=63121 RepID=UPI00396A251C
MTTSYPSNVTTEATPKLTTEISGNVTTDAPFNTTIAVPTNMTTEVSMNATTEFPTYVTTKIIETTTVTDISTEALMSTSVGYQSTAPTVTNATETTTTNITTDVPPSTSTPKPTGTSAIPTTNPTTVTSPLTSRTIPTTPAVPDESSWITMSLQLLDSDPDDPQVWKQIELDLAELYDKGVDNLNSAASEGRRKRDINGFVNGSWPSLLVTVDADGNSTKPQDNLNQCTTSACRLKSSIGALFQKIASIKEIALKKVDDFLVRNGLRQISNNRVASANWRNLDSNHRNIRAAGDTVTTLAPSDTQVSIIDRTDSGNDEYDIVYYVMSGGETVPATEATDAYSTLSDAEMSATLGHVVTSPPTTYVPVEDDGSNTWIWIVVGVVSAVVLIVIIVIIICCCCKRDQSEKPATEEKIEKQTKPTKMVFESFSDLRDKTTSIDMAGLRIDIERGEIMVPSTDLSKVNVQNGQVQETALDNNLVGDGKYKGKRRSPDKFEQTSFVSEGDGDSLSIKPRNIEDIPPDRRPKGYHVARPVKLASSYESLTSAVSMDIEEPDRDNSLFSHVVLMSKIEENPDTKDVPPVKFKSSIPTPDLFDLSNLPTLQQTPLVGTTDRESEQIKMMKEAGVPKSWYKTKKDMEPDKLGMEIERWKTKQKQREKLRKDKERRRKEKEKQKERERLENLIRPTSEREVERDLWYAAQPEIDEILAEETTPAARQMKEARSERWKKHPHKAAMPSSEIPNGEVQFKVKKMGRNTRARPRQVIADHDLEGTDSDNVELVSVRPIGGRYPQTTQYMGDPYTGGGQYNGQQLGLQSGYAWMPHPTVDQLPQQQLFPQQLPQQQHYLQQLPPQAQQQLFQPVDSHPVTLPRAAGAATTPRRDGTATEKGRGKESREQTP